MNIKYLMNRFLCKIGLHKWYSHHIDLVNRWGIDRCKLCGKINHWGPNHE
jgi:hypothetical protein